MRCTNPRTVGFQADGKTISWSAKNYSKEYATFQLPCSKCIACRLDYARQWAVRCVHEAAMYEQNSFITLTYSDENLKSTKLIYSDFQKFMKRLRKLQDEPIGVFVTGEYGDKTKRPHWHAIIFNWSPRDSVKKYTTDRGDQVWESATLSKLWPYGLAEFGSVTFESAGYVARYAAKKLNHGFDGHEYEPISKKSNKHAIGKKWLEKFYPDVFNQGNIILADGATCAIPRYYEKWFKENHPEKWRAYVTQQKQIKIDYGEKMSAADAADWEIRQERLRDKTRNDGLVRPQAITRLRSRELILKSKFKLLQANLKL